MNNELPFVSIIVLNYNGKHHLHEFILSIENLNYPKSKFELLIVDNGSLDGSVEYLKKNYPWITLIVFEKNYGFAEGNNLALEYAKGEFIAFINNDTVVEKDWLIEMAKYALIEENAIFCSKMIRYDHKNIIVFCGSKLLFWGVPFSFEVYKEDYINKREEKIISFYADGCGMLIKKELFIKLGKFDKDYFAYAEDYDLSWKAWLSGCKIYCIPSSRFYHKISSTYGSRSDKYIFLLWRNSITNIIKYVEIKNLFKMLFFHLAFSFAVYLFLFVPEKKYKMIYPILKAYFYNLKDIKSAYYKRKDIQMKRVVSDSEMFNNGLIMSFKDSIRQNKEYLQRKKDFEQGYLD